MKSASRRVRTPVGNKTKRGAELEGTPKTPKAFEASPGKSPCIDGSAQEPDDRSLPLRSRRPLQWNSIPKQGVVGDNDTRGENTLSPHQQQVKLKCMGGSKEVAALSPICLNAIHANAEQQGAGRKTGSKKPYDVPSIVMSPSIKNCVGTTDMKRQGKAQANDWNARQDDDDARSTDAGSCPSSPDLPSSGKPVLIWSNALFNTQPSHNETVIISKDTASSSSCSSSASSSRQDAASNARADSEAESRSQEHDSSSKRESGSCPSNNGASNNGAGASATVGSLQRPGISEPKAVENLKREFANGFKSGSDVFSMAKKSLFESSKSTLTDNDKEAGPGRIDFPPFSPIGTKHTQAGKLQAGGAVEKEEEEMKGGLDEIQQEIERLTERLVELHLQKRKREEEIQRRKQAKIDKTTDSRAKEVEAGNGEKLRQDKRSGGGAGGRVKGVNGASHGRSSSVRQSPKVQPQKSNGVASKSRDQESPLISVGRRAQGPAASVSKLSDLRRSVSSTGRRMERNSSDERTKALRRLSLSGAATTTTTTLELKSQQQQQQQQGGIKSQPSKGTPSRIVSSRYGRAITPDACRPCASGTPQQTSSKKRDRSSASAASSPLPAQPQPSPSASASVTCSPLKKAATFRSGYPSRSGFSTPTKDRETVIKPAMTVSSSVQLPPSTLLSSLTQSQDRTRLLLSSPRCMSPVPRLDSPKSTAALYKCLESLLEDSKHFFKRLSPARPNRLPQQQGTAIAGGAGATSSTSPSACECSPKQLLAAMENALPSINTCRLNAFSPRDSGCVKRASDRQNKRFYFAQEESIPEALESA